MGLSRGRERRWHFQLAQLMTDWSSFNCRWKPEQSRGTFLLPVKKVDVRNYGSVYGNYRILIDPIRHELVRRCLAIACGRWFGEAGEDGLVWVIGKIFLALS